jgi:two-component system, NtrC family, response regulator PilR
VGKILVVDDEQNMRRILVANLRQEKHMVTEAEGVTAARACLEQDDYDVVITDQHMPDGTGLDVLTAVKQGNPVTAVVFLTAVGTIELAVESMKHGAFDFLTKPFSPEVVKGTVRRASEHTALLRENDLLKGTLVRLEGSSDIYGDSPSIQQVREVIGRVAPTNATVLITGETGTGKELVARGIHRNSRRNGKPFVAVNCAVFTDTLLESELFGHEKGAFTGADRARQGLFEAADGGTLFLDEAGEMSMAAQAKLLRVLTDGQVLRVGSTRPRSVDVRVLVATHRDLQQRVRDGLFREDLYYRLAVVPIHLSPLRERRKDLSGLCELLSRRVAQDLKVSYRQLSREAISKLESYPFPGNVRELRNLIERAYILSPAAEIGPESFPVTNSVPVHQERNGGPDDWTILIPEISDLRAFLSQTEKALLERALASSNGAQAEAARRVGLSRSDFGYKLSKYKIKTSNPSNRIVP